MQSISRLTTLEQAHRLYLENGYQPIPLTPNSKRPARTGWQSIDTLSQWRDAPRNSNIGLRGGSGFVAVDADDKNVDGSSDAVLRWLFGLGFDPDDLPTVATPSGGRHVYLGVDRQLFGSKRKLARTFGNGDIIYGKGGQVVASPSTVNGRMYKLLTGDLTQLPKIDLVDLFKLFENADGLEDRLSEVTLTQKARAILTGGLLESVYHNDRSKMEQGLMYQLVLKANTLEQIQQVFYNSTLERFHEMKPKEQQAYLIRGYEEAVRYIGNGDSETRKLIKQIQDWLYVRPLNKTTDTLVYQAHLTVAYNAGSLHYGASVRQLSELANVSRPTAGRATHRLLDAGLMTLEREAVLTYSNRYALNVEPWLEMLDAEVVSQSVPNRDNTTRTVCVVVSQNGTTPEERDIALQNAWAGEVPLHKHDAFANGSHRLGLVAGRIYEALTISPMTASQLSKNLRISRRTVYRKLARMSQIKDYKTGEVINMVTKDETTGRWSAEWADLDVISAIMETYGHSGKRKARHERERKERRINLELGSSRK